MGGKSVVIDDSPPRLPTAEEVAAFKKKALGDPEQLARLREMKRDLIANGEPGTYDVAWIPDEDAAEADARKGLV